ncbi:MAG: hypothetical protein HC837_21680, partial [Chloroflexaceae bacterium]|nr:hypothetical protein [Chloroflexaceae bacterium]
DPRPPIPDTRHLAELVQRAAQCALAVQQVLHGYEASNGWRIALRIGIDAGEMLLACVGGMLGYWEYVARW